MEKEFRASICKSMSGNLTSFSNVKCERIMDLNSKDISFKYSSRFSDETIQTGPSAGQLKFGFKQAVNSYYDGVIDTSNLNENVPRSCFHASENYSQEEKQTVICSFFKIFLIIHLDT